MGAHHGSHAHAEGHGPGHMMHGRGPMGPGGPMQILFANVLITQFVARIWMVITAIALVKIASSLALGARVKVMNDLRADLTEEQREELMADIWRRVERKRMANCCSGMMRKKPAPAEK